jgi:hypothetical protein
MFPFASQGGHSAEVKMRLLVSGLSIPVAQMGPDFVLLESPVNHPPARACVELQVDQSKRSWNVLLPHGISAGTKRVAIAAGA